MQRISLLLIFILVSFSSIGQQYLNARQLRLLNNTDSTGINSTTGIVRYDPITGKYRFYNALTGTWFSYGTGGGAFWPLGGSAALTSNVAITGSSLIGIGLASDGLSKVLIKGNGIGSNPILSLYNNSEVTRHIFLENGNATIGDFVFSASGDAISNTTSFRISGGGNSFDVIGTGFTTDGLQYFNSTNQILLENSAVTHTTSIFGGEIQLDFPGGFEDLTINNSGISSTGTPFIFAVNSGDFTLSSNSSDIILDPASDVIFSPGGLTIMESPGNTSTTAEVLGRNTTSGAIERRTDIFPAGEFAVTVSNGVNLVNATEALQTTFIRAGSYVTVTGFFSALTLTSATTATSFDLSIPIASNFTSITQAFGHIYTGDGAIGTIIADTINDRVDVSFTSVGTSTTGHFTFTYQIL